MVKYLQDVWKDLKVEMNIEFLELNFGYGSLRAAWNMNPSPYISRDAFTLSNLV
jgi:hypothetical protein